MNQQVKTVTFTVVGLIALAVVWGSIWSNSVRNLALGGLLTVLWISIVAGMWVLPFIIAEIRKAPDKWMVLALALGGVVTFGITWLIALFKSFKDSQVKVRF